eukprot:TRINITY_DN1195_c0_g1_i1.p1 TRINITY_DN1195_c0_g1~~TRINITY_DN1195_c0_g1_i1.p1  ORF type:complete len:305 (-),score=46.90 TRINITY_DN1195_c0_g1_i1:92-1006(-)
MSQGLYSCSLCGKAFDAVCHLETHVRSHTGERPYQCDQCEKSFSVMSNLKRHIKTVHVKERFHSCDLCGKTFSQSNNLKRHRKTHESAAAGGNITCSSPSSEDVMTLMLDRSRSSSGGSQMTDESSVSGVGAAGAFDLESICSSRRMSSVCSDIDLDSVGGVDSVGGDYSPWCNVDLELMGEDSFVLESPQDCGGGGGGGCVMMENGITAGYGFTIPEVADESISTTSMEFPVTFRRSRSLTLDEQQSEEPQLAVPMEAIVGTVMVDQSEVLPCISRQSTPDAIFLSRNSSGDKFALQFGDELN